MLKKLLIAQQQSNSYERGDLGANPRISLIKLERYFKIHQGTSQTFTEKG